ncbi:MAG: LytTR family transcriptional regulator [Candidatus Aminicenantes bacterium]|nr:LytTR family transcriptional regulator [Candidatus Aminicenantes bacterium]
MIKAASVRYQFFAWLIYWLFLLLLNFLYFEGDHYSKPLLALWTVLFTLFGIGLFYLQTRVYRRLVNQKRSKAVLFSVSIILSMCSAYLWGLTEPVLSWLINPEIHEVSMKWDINSRGTISLTFVLAFFSLLYIFSTYRDDSSSPARSRSEAGNGINSGTSTVAVYHKNSLVLLPLDEIKKISVDGNYSTIIDARNRRFELKKSLSLWERELDPQKFLRVHRSTIINRAFIEKIDLWQNYTLRIKMIGLDMPEDVSRRYAALLKKRLKI